MNAASKTSEKQELRARRPTAHGSSSHRSRDSARLSPALIAIILLCLLTHLFAPNAPAAQAPLPQTSTAPQESKPPTAQPAGPQAQSSGESAPSVGRVRSLTHLFLGVALGFGSGLARLLFRFRRFWGLGLFTNLYSWFFLVLVAATSGVSYMLVEGSAMWSLVSQSVSSELTALVGIFGSPVVGNLTTLLGRLSRRSPQDTGSKELDDAKSTNQIFELIRQSITDGLHREVVLMARRYDLGVIKETISQLVENEITMGSLASAEGETFIQFIRAIEPSSDPGMVFNTKYSALCRAIRVTSFSQLRSRLARAASEQP